MAAPSTSGLDIWFARQIIHCHVHSAASNIHHIEDGFLEAKHITGCRFEDWSSIWPSSSPSPSISTPLCWHGDPQKGSHANFTPFFSGMKRHICFFYQ